MARHPQDNTINDKVNTLSFRLKQTSNLREG
jgi:hypothetical protein